MKNEHMKKLQRALQMKKPSRIGAANEVSAGLRGEAMDVNLLYAFFLPPVPSSKPRTQAKWMQAALAPKSEKRVRLRYFNSDGSRIYATDGHVLNVCGFNSTFTFPEGFYDAGLVRTALPGEQVKIQKIDRVVPIDTTEVVYRLSELEVYEIDGDFENPPSIVYKIGEGYFYREVLAKALQGRYMFTVCNADAGREDAIKIKGPFDNSFSVVMPMRYRR